jgi:hypothetical protein
MAFIFFTLWWEMNENTWGYWWIKYLLFTFLSAGLFLSPVDDISVDDRYIYHFRTSLLKYFNKVDKYELSTIKSIRCLGVHVPGLSLQELVGAHRQISTSTNSVEIVFKDGTYKSLEVAIYKRELIFYLSKIRERLDDENK